MNRGAEWHRSGAQATGESKGAILEVRNLWKTFGRGTSPAVAGVSFAVGHDEILAVLGPSGCGKTTTLRIIAGLEYPDDGDILVRGKSVVDVPTHRRNVGLMFQDLAIFPHKTVFENVAFGLRVNRVPSAELIDRVEAALRLVELSPEIYAKRFPLQLSGGERQRVAFARTLVVQPSLVLFDEPMSALDRRLRDRMAVEVRQIQKRLGLPAVYVTHDQESASMLADRIIVMQAGSIVQEGTPIEIYRRPQSRFVANFVGDMNFLTARVRQSTASETVVEFAGQPIRLPPHDVRAGELVALTIRPEDLRVSRIAKQNSFASGRLLGWHFMGGVFVYRIRLKEGSDVVARASSDSLSTPQTDDLWLEVDSEKIGILKE